MARNDRYNRNNGWSGRDRNEQNYSDSEYTHSGYRENDAFDHDPYEEGYQAGYQKGYEDAEYGDSRSNIPHSGQQSRNRYDNATRSNSYNRQEDDYEGREEEYELSDYGDHYNYGTGGYVNRQGGANQGYGNSGYQGNQDRSGYDTESSSRQYRRGRRGGNYGSAQYSERGYNANNQGRRDNDSRDQRRTHRSGRSGFGNRYQ